jgi:hypothetical protein
MVVKDLKKVLYSKFFRFEMDFKQKIRETSKFKIQ